MNPWIQAAIDSAQQQEAAVVAASQFKLAMLNNTITQAQAAASAHVAQTRYQADADVAAIIEAATKAIAAQREELESKVRSACIASVEAGAFI